jgi:O-acetyl-ADP-ribose deacetylase (regulator of RNase III)
MVEIIQGDITQQIVDVIVNAANSSLMGGGGVDGAIHRAGGRAILEECKRIVASQGRCATGQCVATTGGEMAAIRVVHAVGPIWHRHHPEQAAELLADCYRNSLDLCASHGHRTIAFPNISTGVYGFPKEEASQIAISTVQNWLAENPGVLEKVIFVCYDDENYELYYNAFFI